MQEPSAHWNSSGRQVATAQCSSSDLSLQSASPSQTQLRWIHSLLPQWNSREEQGLLTPLEAVSRPWQFCGHSSEPSTQSTSPSQAQRLGMHMDELQRKWAGPQVVAWQWASSEPSRQSRSPSHTNCGEMHLPSWHRKSSWEHVLGGQPCSSESFSQSTCPSHLQESGMHRLTRPPQLN